MACGLARHCALQQQQQWYVRTGQLNRYMWLTARHFAAKQHSRSGSRQRTQLLRHTYCLCTRALAAAPHGIQENQTPARAATITKPNRSNVAAPCNTWVRLVVTQHMYTVMVLHEPNPAVYTIHCYSQAFIKNVQLYGASQQ
jgi:hypothetical protein